ncbi:MAG: thioredoxin family protein [Bacilli bacterium]
MSKKSGSKKEIGILLGIVGIGIIIFTVFQLAFNDNDGKEFNKLVPTITYSEFQEKINNSDDFILIYGSETCSACKDYKATITEVFKDDYKDIDTFYIDIDSFSDGDKSSIASYLGAKSTPTSYIFISGVMNDSIEGNQDLESIVNFFELYKSYAK